MLIYPQVNSTPVLKNQGILAQASEFLTGSPEKFYYLGLTASISCAPVLIYPQVNSTPVLKNQGILAQASEFLTGSPEKLYYLGPKCYTLLH